MKIIALVLAAIGAVLTVSGLLGVMDVIDTGDSYTTWAPIVGILAWFVALALFTRAAKAQPSLHAR